MRVEGADAGCARAFDSRGEARKSYQPVAKRFCAARRPQF
jgi:hypothetical protein